MSRYIYISEEYYGSANISISFRVFMPSIDSETIPQAAGAQLRQRDFSLLGSWSLLPRHQRDRYKLTALGKGASVYNV
jgi:hypothetical protein